MSDETFKQRSCLHTTLAVDGTLNTNACICIYWYVLHVLSSAVLIVNECCCCCCFFKSFRNIIIGDVQFGSRSGPDVLLTESGSKVFA